MGEQHIELAVRRMETKFGVGLLTAVPKVPYRESITKSASDYHRHKKQTGGAGQFGEVHMEIKPLPTGSGLRVRHDPGLRRRDPEQLLPVHREGHPVAAG